MHPTFTIYINQQTFEFDEPVNILEAAEKFGAQRPFVLMLNNEFIPQSQHNSVFIQANDSLEIISAIQGG